MKYLLLILSLCYSPFVGAQIITEIMYNPPESGIDSLEYLEIYNDTDITIDITGYSLIGVDHTFTEPLSLVPGEYYVLCKDSVAFESVFRFSPRQWSDGALSNTGEEVGLIDASGDVVFSVVYGRVAPWVTTADGNGSSLELCPGGDPQEPASWNLSQDFQNIIINFSRIAGSPRSPNMATCQKRDYQFLAISELLPQGPQWDTDLEYIEFHNYGTETINLAEWSVSGDVLVQFFPNVQVEPGGYYLIGNDPLGLSDFGILMPGIIGLDLAEKPFLLLTNPNGALVSSVNFDADENHPTPEAGIAIELCDPTEDPTIGKNWVPSTQENFSAGISFIGTPGRKNICEGISSSVENNLSASVKIFPNPCQDNINISSDFAIDEVTIFNSTGQLVRRHTSKTILMTQLPTGTYFVKIRSGKEFFFQRLYKTY